MDHPERLFDITWTDGDPVMGWMYSDPLNY